MTIIYTDKNSVTREQIEESHNLEVKVPGISEELKAELESRIKEFEECHEWEALHGGNGWVERIKKRDVIIAMSISAVFFVWWLVAVVR